MKHKQNITVKNMLNSTYGSCKKSLINNNFLSYQWGVFVSNTTRQRFEDMLNVVSENFGYIDTDNI